MIQIAHRSWTHAGDKPGRFQVLDLPRPRIVGVLSNTPWPIAGEHVPSRMLDAARGLTHEAFVEPSAACAALLQRLRTSLEPFSGAAAWGTTEDWEASWDFGGDAAFVAEVGGELALARVGANWVLLGTPEVLELLDAGTASQHLGGRPFPAAAQRVFEDVHETLVRIDSLPSSALVVVELSA